MSKKKVPRETRKGKVVTGPLLVAGTGSATFKYDFIGRSTIEIMP